MTMTTVALSKLIPSAANVRRYNSEAGIEALAADISAHGLIQSLNVKPAGKGKFEVLAAGRRLRALKHLQTKGGSILGVKVTKDYQVPVLQGPAEGVTETEISAAENFRPCTPPRRLPPSANSTRKRAFRRKRSRRGSEFHV
ncbi:ParB/Srx family N-terminal domain-containing protein [Microvirga tunisiensis]|uniref:ParB-like N-terminal domain-containing protein n=1 Tax=Microvirga tunisiensis TaxID=2108360 RepID=A0A5N7MKG3_9HYPH|nr:ParB/Srx family N-terminal domain-containing protein [Microvirga tunisiensis]MPR08940.1 hypothetical protein [Microvirga tunisiensis]MPR27130.1 hypothetical protein [Microvirga tunisiensis]